MPPALSPAEEGRMKALSARASSAMRVLAEDRPAAALRGGIDGEHGDMPAECYAVEAEALDKGRFAGTGRAGYADPNRTPGIGQQRLDEPFGRLAMVGAGRFDEGDGAGERPPVAPPHGCDQ